MARKLFNVTAPLVMFEIICTKISSKLFLPKKTINSTQKSLPFFSSIEEPHPNHTLVFHLEGVLLKSSSIFPYFMLVAFEAGSPIRALILLLVYPFLCLVGEELCLRIMVFVCFFGIKEESFGAGRAVLPKVFLENIGEEGFDMVMKWRRKVAVSNMPRIMVQEFMGDYLGTEAVFGRELKVLYGFYIGLLDDHSCMLENLDSPYVISIQSNTKLFDNCEITSLCKGIHFVSEAEKRRWQLLPRKKYLKPLIFHDGRLAFMPSPLASLAMLMWIPFGLVLLIIRLLVGILLPYKASTLILSFTGMRAYISDMHSSDYNLNEFKGRLYVCNHKTLLDPIYTSIILRKPLTAVTYSLSKMVELVSPIKTVRLTRNHDRDLMIINTLLKQGDVVVCPEGTTCREPYLLRFSPLFAESRNDIIIPVGLDYKVSMFYGTSAGGLKLLDPVFLLMNPTTLCYINVLEKLDESNTCQGGKSKFEVANYVQTQIAKALDFECTGFTRKHKYLLLAGNDGIVQDQEPRVDDAVEC